MADPLPHAAGWRFWIDRGGTFTDIIAVAPDGRRRVSKRLSAQPDGGDPVLAAIREVLGLAADASVPAGAVAELRVGTTLTTNALLEGRSARCAVVLNAGHGDLLRIGDQSRPALFDLDIQRSTPLHACVIETAARLDADGGELAAVDEAALRVALEAARADGCEALAIALLHATRSPAHERRIAELARAAGFAHVICSHEVSALPGLLERARTALVEAALAPLFADYRAGLRAALPGARIRFMQSAGGLADIDVVAARDSVLSGPAGGVIGAGRVADAAGCGRLVGLDMGGTSTDVFHRDGDVERVGRSEIAGQRLRIPMLAIHTVAAGGGSRIHYDGGRLRVGPESAGADPGPACYGRGGPATVTDANLLLGRVRAGQFPPVFGPQGDAPLDVAAARTAFDALAARIAREEGRAVSAEDVAWGALAIAVDSMAAAVRRISLRRGIDLAGHTLCAFGGAGPQHACAIADALDLRQLLVPDRASVLSALGIGLADLLVLREQAIDGLLDELPLTALHEVAQALATDAAAELREQGVEHVRVELQARLRLRHAEDSIDLTLPGPDVAEALAPAALRRSFHAAHEQRYGYIDNTRPVEWVALLAVARGGGAALMADAEPTTAVADEARGTQSVYLAMAPDAPPGWQTLPLTVPPQGDATLDGPALVALAGSSLLLAPGWRLRRVAAGLLAERCRPLPGQRRSGIERDPVRLEICNNRFMAIAEQMGEALQRSAQSVNVRERLDYSCALFDAGGQLIANAPHIPVHLGSMGVAVRHILATRGDRLAPGDAWLLNDPYAGGTHLPDLTLISPVHDGQGRLCAFVASRAHHADIGGISPGSMPAHSRHIEEEGLLFDGFHAADAAGLREAELRAALAAGAWPSRNVDANVADLRAQLAANRRGAALFLAMADEFGLDVVRAYMAHVQDAAEEAVRRRLAEVRGGGHTLTLDTGACIAVQATPLAGGGIEFDFSASSAQGDDNFNAPAAVVHAAVLYVLRCLIDEDIPLNEGCLRPVRIRLTPGSMLSPRPPAAVVAGNVETSQCVVDALLGALGAQAGSQGTMNNLSFGDAQRQYYETLCGGTGGGPGFAGASAVHSHMTNSRITDAEILERRYPVRVERFAIRHGSGGAGRWPGGDGAVRELRFLAPMQVALLGNHRRHAPQGLAGGAPGQCGENLRIHADGRVTALPACMGYQAAAGECLRVSTPGGGGYGADNPASG